MSSEWRRVRIGDIGRVITGKTPSTSDAANFGGPYPFITIPDLNQGREVNKTERSVSEKGASSLRTCLLPSNAVLMSCIATIGKTGITTRPSFTNQQINSVICGREVLPKYLYYVFSQLGRELEAAGGGGSVYTNVSKSKFSDIEIPAPSIQEQAAISELLGLLDDRITLLRETNATLEAIAQALFKSWFVDFDPVRAKQEGRAPEGMSDATAALFPDRFEESELGLVPKGWRVAKFGDFVSRLSVGKKFDQKSARTEGAVPILDQGKSGVIGFHNEIPGVIANLDDPVVVFANHTCYMRLISFPFSAIQNVLPFKGKEVDTIWAFYATKDRVKFSEYKGHWPDFAIEKAVLPDCEVTKSFRKAVDPLVRRVRLNEMKTETLAALRDTLLPRLISGQLRLPEAVALIEEAT